MKLNMDKNHTEGSSGSSGGGGVHLPIGYGIDKQALELQKQNKQHHHQKHHNSPMTFLQVSVV